MTIKKVSGHIGDLLGFDVEKELQTCKEGEVRYFDKRINGESVTIVLINRKDGFKILKIKQDGTVKELYR